MKILAIDQSSKLNGYAIFDDNKLINSGVFSAKGKYGQRLFEIGEWLQEIISKNDIEKICFEEVQYQTKDEVKVDCAGPNSNHNTFKRLAQVQGVFIFICKKLQIDFEIVSPSVWRKSVGIYEIYRQPQKQKAQQKVKEWFDKDCGDDEAEAICIGKYFISKNKTFKII